MNRTAPGKTARVRGWKRIAGILLVLLTVAVCAVCFAACDTQEFPQTERGTRTLSLYRLEAGEDGCYYAYFCVGTTSDAYAYADCEYLLEESFNDIRGYVGRITYFLDTAGLADAALTYAAESGSADGISRDNLKIVFVYAIMSARFTSNGEVTESDGYYYHLLTANPDDGEVVFVGETTSYNTVGWYAMIIVSSVAALAVIATAVVLIGRRKWRKKTM